MDIALFCASQRGRRFLQELSELAPEASITVFSFPEDPWELPFFQSIHDLAVSLDCDFHEARSLSNDKWNEMVGQSEFDLMFAVGWRYMIPKSIYERSKVASIVFHDSLLPEYRGFAPSNWAIINGESETGATMLVMGEQVDAGPIIDQVAVLIGANESIREVSAHVDDAYMLILRRGIQSLLEGKYSSIAQDETLATYTSKRTPEDGRIDWNRSAVEIHNLIRAITKPWPGAYTEINGEKLMIWSSEVQATKRYVGSVPGRVVELSVGSSVGIATGDGVLLIGDVQLAGKDTVKASTLLRSITDSLGRRF